MKKILFFLLLSLFSCSLPSMNCVDVANRIQKSLTGRGIESKQLCVWNYDSKWSHIFVIYSSKTSKNGRLFACDAYNTIPVGNKMDASAIGKILDYDCAKWIE